MYLSLVETNTYDGLNQLIGFTDGETTASYKYNASGLRYEKTVMRDTVCCGGKEISFFSSSLLRFTSDTGTSRAVGKRVIFPMPCFLCLNASIFSETPIPMPETTPNPVTYIFIG